MLKQQYRIDVFYGWKTISPGPAIQYFGESTPEKRKEPWWIKVLLFLRLITRKAPNV